MFATLFACVLASLPPSAPGVEGAGERTLPWTWEWAGAPAALAQQTGTPEELLGKYLDPEPEPPASRVPS